jgi:outer membrane protein TolC
MNELKAPGRLTLALVFVTGCARFEPAPVSPSHSAARLEARSLADPELRSFLEDNLHRELPEWPLRTWDLRALTLAAFYFHPALDVARAQWRVAQAGEITAGARPNPAVSVGPQYNLNAASGVTPWLAFADFEIPIETAGKRGYRVAQARHLSQAARLNIVAAAWQVRSGLRDALLDWASASQRLELLRRQAALQEQALQRLDQKLAAGAIAGAEVLPHRIALQKARVEAGEAERLRAEARGRVAAALSVPLAALVAVELPAALPDFPATNEWTTAEARRAALHGRADLLAALADYEASQAALQLEVARQYPDLKLGPGYEYDQGENKFGLLLGAELPVFNRNAGPIAAARARREEAAARFTALQARMLGEIDSALAATRAAGEQLAKVDQWLATQRLQQERLQAQWAAGTAESLDLLAVQIELAGADVIRQETLARQQRARAQLEDALQRPLDLDVTAAPRRLGLKSE